MKVLWITRTCPFPANDGEKLRQFNLLKALAAVHEVTLVCRVMTDEQRLALGELRKIGISVHGVYIPPPKNNIERLKWLLPFLFSWYPIAACTMYFSSINKLLKDIAKTQVFDIVQVEHPWMTIYLDKIDFVSNPLSILTMHNIDYLRNERLIAHTSFGPTKLFHLVSQMKVKRCELETLEKYDAVIAMSELERQVLLRERSGLQITVIPNGADCASLPYIAPEESAVTHVVFVASLDSEANHDGAMYFLDDILPLLRDAIPTITISIVGRGPRADLLARGSGQQVVVTGQVDSVLPYYRAAAVAVVPLRSGGGTRLKILEAMALGTPVVSTTVGAEGLDLVDREHLLLADTATEFAAAIEELLTSRDLRVALSKRARQYVEAHYDWRQMGEKHDQLYRSMVAAAHG